ncbi:MAG: PIN domain nuclease [Acidobacteriota bacterium]|nr:PIN domain nuclease [Acidobacteriota bacterium]
MLVDTCIWSLSLRRQLHDLGAEDLILHAELRELVAEGRVQLVGPVRQEVLSGIRNQSQYQRLSKILRSFADEPPTTADYELAARMSNDCRAAGIAGSAIDFLLCAVASARHWSLFTNDSDFQAFSSVFPVPLHKPRR